MKKNSKALPAIALVSVLGAAMLVFAQSAEPTLELGTSDQWGDHLVTNEGRSVYLYVLDEEGASACLDACINNWPPVIIEPGAEPELGEGLDSELVGTLERADGALQLTYGGHPLYTFRRDTEAGHTRGQALGNQFFLVAATGEAVTETADEQTVEIPEAEMAALLEEGQLVFRTNCAACHGAEGQGGIGPRFVGNGQLADGAYVATRVIDGFIDHGMPPFGGVLNDRQIAAVATYIRNSWGNEFGAVLEEEVAAKR